MWVRADIELGGGMFGRVKQSAVGIHMVSCGSATSCTSIESRDPSQASASRFALVSTNSCV
jgi:hypothetical protein